LGRAGAATQRNLGDNRGQQGITNLEVSGGSQRSTWGAKLLDCAFTRYRSQAPARLPPTTQGRPTGGRLPWPSSPGTATWPDRDRVGAPSLPAATKAAANSVAVSSAAPIAHHQKKANTDATSRPNPRPATKAPTRADQGRRVSAASSRCRRCHRPPASSPVPASEGTSATSTSDNPRPGLIGTSTGPSRRAGTTNRIKARPNKVPHPSNHFIPVP